MKLSEALLQTLPTTPIPVRRIVVGVHWTAVCSKYCGLASTLANVSHPGDEPVRDVGSLHQKSAQELAGWILSEHSLEASIGMAALNSLLEIDERQMVELNAAKIIAERGKGKNIAVVGHFPFVSKLPSIARNCWVIEKNPTGTDFPEEAAQDLIPQADVVAITGTALINHTLEKLLSLCAPNALVIVLGPSSPLSPLWFDHGVSVVSGSRVWNEQAALFCVEQGARFPQVQGVRLLNLVAAGVALQTD